MIGEGKFPTVEKAEALGVVMTNRGISNMHTLGFRCKKADRGLDGLTKKWNRFLTKNFPNREALSSTDLLRFGILSAWIPSAMACTTLTEAVYNGNSIR